jgi:membrane protease YdiL (CAAX protease family)
MAAVGGLTIGFFPGWVAVKLSEAFPELGLGALEAINSGLSDGSLPARLMMALVVAVIGPVAEEFVFRGFVWERLRAFLPMPAVWVVSSLIFAAYHGDPVHVLAVSITGLYLGWFRWMTGSIWPAVLVHVLNNSLGATQALTGNVDAVLPAWIPGVTGVIALAAGAAVWRAASARASE